MSRNENIFQKVDWERKESANENFEWTALIWYQNYYQDFSFNHVQIIRWEQRFAKNTNFYNLEKCNS